MPRVFLAEEILLDLLYATIARHLLIDVLIIVKEADCARTQVEYPRVAAPATHCYPEIQATPSAHENPSPLNPTTKF